MPNLRKAHDVPVRGVVTKGADTYDIVREKADSVDEEVLDCTSDVSATDEMDQEALSSKTASSQAPRCRKMFRIDRDQEELDQLRNDWLMGELEVEVGCRELKPARERIENRARLKHAYFQQPESLAPT